MFKKLRCKFFGHKWRSRIDEQNLYIEDFCLRCNEKKFDPNKSYLIIYDIENENGELISFSTREPKLENLISDIVQREDFQMTDKIFISCRRPGFFTPLRQQTFRVETTSYRLTAEN